MTGICVPDDITKSFIDKRRNPKHKKLAKYYRPDEDARYAESYTIDLHNVESFVARYPKPDDVVPVGVVAGTALDGCFIGACTTAREDLVLAALVLEAGLKRGFQPVSRGKRKVVPGSRPILHELRENGLALIYEQAGFEIGVPGCSYCVGMSADKASKGEVWLSSQNRNFENRMGPGAIGSIASAVTVAASSFGMTITDPSSLLDDIDQERLQAILGTGSGVKDFPQYVEPPSISPAATADTQAVIEPLQREAAFSGEERSRSSQVINGMVQTLGDFIDTDALAPSEALVAGPLTPEQLGEYCLYHTHPDFRRRVKEGMNVVVAGSAFGVGSSRENAVTALMGTGVKCVIARSFAFIYARNQPNLGLLGIVMNDEKFYELAKDGAEIEINVDERIVVVGGNRFPFTVSDLEVSLWKQGGISEAFKIWGKGLLEKMTATKGSGRVAAKETSSAHPELSW